MLFVHIMTVNLLLVSFPFTKLSHFFTLFIARYYNGQMAGRKGVKA
jgi:nitrate reductase gamma subunit